MYLIEVSANKPSFQTVKFKEGLNFIVGGISKEQEKELRLYDMVNTDQSELYKYLINVSKEF